MDKVILNVDTGIDDAFAMILLKRYGITPEFIVAASGNSTLENTYRNTVGVAKLLEFDCPVYYGSFAPVLRPHLRDDFHGKNGIGCYKFKDVSIKNSENGIIKMEEALKKERYTIICTSPMTSLAILLRLDERIKKNINNIIIMGGAFGITPYGKGNMGDAEFNVFYDPEAAKIVFESDINETIIPLDLTMNHELSISELPKSNKSDPLNEFIYKTTEFMLKEHKSFEMHDPLAAFSFIEPEAYKYMHGEIEVYSSGVTVFKEDSNSRKKIATGIDIEKYNKRLKEVIYFN
ncbi:nucleoside hydrolase [Ferroplasma sp.]|uniref:nucleoside hydrolase n=1 Tax=Ferroplasma sp. TaxID=2591003 RepID=UPI00307F4859